ncbi:MAG: hypothetical protein V4510_00295 [bacterium]
MTQTHAPGQRSATAKRLSDRGRRTPSAIDRHVSDVRPRASRLFHEQLRTSLGGGAKLAAPTMVKSLRGAFLELGRDAVDAFGDGLAGARALASIYAAWMETLDPQVHDADTRLLKHLSDAGWIEAQLIVSAYPQADAMSRREFLQRGAIEATEFVIGDGMSVPQRNDLAWLGGFAAGLQGLSTGHGEKAQQAV